MKRQPRNSPIPERNARVKARFVIPILLSSLVFVFKAPAQTAYIADAWWSYQQDCNGDGCWAGTLPGNLARLNWEPDVTNCNGTLTVYEKVYARACGTIPWTPLYTNAPHNITGCSTLGQQHLDLPLSSGCACQDYKIEEPDHAGNPGGHSLWYCWTATTNLPVTFDTLGSSFDTLLAVYTGSSVSNLTLVASNDDIAGATNRLSSVAFTPVAGTTYHVAVDGYGGASGIVVLNWNQTGSALPDLIFWAPAVAPSITTRTFATNDCEVLEGCATPGTRRLLRFNVETRNIGLGD